MPASRSSARRCNCFTTPSSDRFSAAAGGRGRKLLVEVVRKQPDGTWLFVIDNPYTPE
jgi:hypothetical protein